MDDRTINAGIRNQAHLKTRQIDFTNAFCQADMPKGEKVHVEMPKGFGNGQDCVLQLRKSLHGMVKSPLYWYNTVKESFEALGCVPSPNDRCMLINKETKTIVLIYTDDCLIFGYDDASLDKLVSDLKEKHELDEQAISPDVFACLGIELNMEGDRVEMLQTGLTDKVPQTVKMENCTPNETPAKEEPLSTDAEGEPFGKEWDCASVVGMLVCLMNTRPDTQFAVHQCAKFTHQPRQCHANAVKKMCRCSQGTKNWGIKFNRKLKNNEDFRVDCHVDASFAPLWNVETNEDSSKSRTGYVILIDDVPITWCSRKQGETALSTTEAECIALSKAMCELMWVRRLVEETCVGMNVKCNRKAIKVV